MGWWQELFGFEFSALPRVAIVASRRSCGICLRMIRQTAESRTGWRAPTRLELDGDVAYDCSSPLGNEAITADGERSLP